MDASNEQVEAEAKLAFDQELAALTAQRTDLKELQGKAKDVVGLLTLAGTFLGAVPSGIVAARAGVKPTVIAGMSTVAVCTVAFGLGDQAWQLDRAC